MTTRVRCLACRECGTEFPLTATHVCDLCFGPLDVRYDANAVARAVSRAPIDRGPASIWRYRDLLPVDVDDESPPVTLGEGFTPLLRADHLAEELGIRRLYLKNETVNPTGSFKDRVVSVAATWARQNGFATLACASTGNLANAVAAYGARARIPAYVFIPADLERAKVIGSAVYGPTLVRVEGTYDDVNRLCAELADERRWAFCNINVRPYYSEGSKTLTYETAEQLGWRLPDEIVIPVASGCQFVKHARAVRELVEYGLVPPRSVALTGAQAAGCAPVADAFAAAATACTPVRPRTLARSIAIGNPSDGGYVLRHARASGGVVASAEEEEILEGIELLARTEGVFAETAGGVTVAVLRRLARAGRWQDGRTVVAYVTGHGLKTAEVLQPGIRDVEPIRPSVAAFRAAYGGDEVAAPQLATVGTFV